MTSLLPETGRLGRRRRRPGAGGRAGRRRSSLGVVRDGAAGALRRRRRARRPATGARRRHQYRIGSITKTMTAALVLQLRDEGRLGLDDLLYRHLPGTPVGERHAAPAARPRRRPAARARRRLVGARPPAPTSTRCSPALTPDKVAYPPHRTYHYSNLAYGLLGAVARTGSPARPGPTLLGKRLLDPLGMTRTTYHPVEPFARGYVVHPWHGTLREEPRTDTGAMAPAGQLWSTVDRPGPVGGVPGRARPGGARRRRRSTEMCAPVVISDLESWTGGHGLGLELYRVGERVYVGHGGSMPGYVATLAVHRPSRDRRGRRSPTRTACRHRHRRSAARC